MSSAAASSLQKISILYNLADKNAQAHQIIQDYAAKHAVMDVTVGLVALIPGAGLAAIMGAIALQSQVIYKPMARDLAAVYLRETDSYTDQLGYVASGATVGMEFAQEFAMEFLAEQAQELAMEAGLGGLATLIPGAGALVAAALDCLIAQMMTWRVGTMTSIYFQNGAEWIGNRKSTMEVAKTLTGGLHVSVTEMLSGAARARKVRVDFDDIPKSVPKVMQSAVRSILPMLKGFADKLPRPVVRESLLAMGLSAVMVDAAMHVYYAQTNAMARPAIATPYQKTSESTATTLSTPGLTRDPGVVILRWSNRQSRLPANSSTSSSGTPHSRSTSLLPTRRAGCR